MATMLHRNACVNVSEAAVIAPAERIHVCDHCKADDLNAERPALGGVQTGGELLVHTFDTAVHRLEQGCLHTRCQVVQGK